MSTLLVTTTSGRPKALEILAKVIDKQTTKDFHWLIVSDDFSGYKTPNIKRASVTVVERDKAGDKLPSINENWLAAIEWIEEREEYDKILPIEDDDYYAPGYVLEMTTLLDRADLAGFEEDAYYYVLNRKARRMHNKGYASLAASGFNRSVLPFLRECCNTGDVFIDRNLWLGIGEDSFHPSPPISLATGQTIQPPPVPYRKVINKCKGRLVLADNFTGLEAGKAWDMKWNDQGKLEVITNEAPLDDEGNIVGEHPRHIGMKEPWHRGRTGISILGHDFRQGGGPDLYGDQLRKWIGKEDAALYLQFTKDPPRNPYPPNIIVPMPIEGDTK